MTTTHRNRLLTAISNTPGAAGALTIAAASSGYRTFAAGDDGLSFDVSIVDGTSWEIRTGCVYTHAGTSLSRGTLEDSSTGSAITLTSAAVVTVTATASLANALETAMQGMTPGGRLTLESGVPVSTTDQTAKTTIYYTPYIHNTIPLWDGSEWEPTTFTEKSLAIGTLTSGKPYDVFGYLNAGQLVLELLSWTSDAARATAVTLQDGRYCKDGDKTRLLLGTFYTTSTTTTEDSYNNRYVANVYSKVPRWLKASGATSHTYTTAAWREFNNGASVTRGNFITCVDVVAVMVGASCSMSRASAGVLQFMQPVVDSVTTPSATVGQINGYGLSPVLYSSTFDEVSPGKHFISCSEYGVTNVTYVNFSAESSIEV